MTYTLTTDGAYTFAVRAIAAGGTDQTPATSAFTLDRVAPQTTIPAGAAGGPSGTVNINSATFNFTSNETGATFECQLDGQTFSTCASPQVYPGPLADGPHTFRVRATDQAGNRDLTEASRAWTIDTVAPTLTINGPAVTNSRTPSFTFSSQDGGTSFECRLDSAPAFTACTSPYTIPAIPSLADGAHTLRVQVRDVAGNLSAPATHSFSIDATLPIARIDSGPASITNSTSATFTFSTTNETTPVTFECKLDAADYAPCSSPQAYATLSNGSHTFRIRATDSAGNLGTPVSQTWAVNTTLPQTTIDTAPPQATNSTAARFTFSSPNEPGANFMCSVDGLPYVACNSPKDYTHLTPGDHVFGVKAINSAGTEDPDPAVHNWTVDTSPPDTTIGSAPGRHDLLRVRELLVLVRVGRQLRVQARRRHLGSVHVSEDLRRARSRSAQLPGSCRRSGGKPGRQPRDQKLERCRTPAAGGTGRHGRVRPGAHQSIPGDPDRWNDQQGGRSAAAVPGQRPRGRQGHGALPRP